MQIILPELARVCLHRGCEVIFEGPMLTCPLCGCQGATFREVEEALTSSMAGPQRSPQIQTSTVQ